MMPVLLCAALVQGALPVKPGRVLIVADARAKDGRVFREAGELADAIGLLNLWGMPFDLLRLDTATLESARLVDDRGQPVYGVILWTARLDLLPRPFREGEVLREAVIHRHISLIALGSRIQDPTVQDLLGLRPAGLQEPDSPISVPKTHFVTRGLASAALAEEAWCRDGPAVKLVAPDVDVLLRAGEWPLATTRTVDSASGTRAVWIGGDANRLLRGQGAGLGIHLFRRAMAWTLGAIVTPCYGNGLLVRMDDPGTAQSSYLRGWDYASLTSSQVRENVLSPLQAQGGRAVIFCCPGYVDAGSRQILRANEVNRTDAFGHRQDIAATFAALREGQSSGQLEIESHGWTHMAPDLDTPIRRSTNFWKGAVDGEWFQEGWYREFYDERRDEEVPPDIQREHIRKSLDWLEKDFGRRPLVLSPPGHAVSGDSFIYPPQMKMALSVRLSGVEPNALYRLLAGADEDWVDLGTLKADGAGNAEAVLTARLGFWLEARGYFTVNRAKGGTEFIAGPFDEPLGMAFDLPVRDSAHMSPAEKKLFYEAGRPLGAGRITGLVDVSSYRPPSRSPACTYLAAASEGIGMVLDTTCESIEDGRVATLRMIQASTSPDEISLHLSRKTGIPAIFLLHDRDIVQDPGFLARHLKRFVDEANGVDFLGAEELAGYLHSRWQTYADDKNGLTVGLDFRSRFCGYLQKHPSRWSVLATDDVMRLWGSPGGRVEMLVDGKMKAIQASARDAAGSIELSVDGDGTLHTISLRPAR